jgi:metallo-beta-lactamase family protein
VLITGFQAGATLGRRIVDGARRVRLFGADVPVNASVHTLGGLSAHAGQSALMQWAHGIGRKPAAVFLAHGEPQAAHALSARLAKELKWAPLIAAPQTRYEA